MFAKYSKTIIEIVILNILKVNSTTVISHDFAWTSSYVLQLAGILQTLFLRNYFKLDSTSCQDTLIKSLQYATLLLRIYLWWYYISISIVKQNFLKSKVKFKINHASIHCYNYTKLQQIISIFYCRLTENVRKKFE